MLPEDENLSPPCTTPQNETPEPAAVLPLISPAQQVRPNGLTFWRRDIVIALSASVLIVLFLYQPVKVEGTSMLPRLEDRDRLFINKFVYHFEDIHPGDVVVLHYPRDPQ